jgi:adenylate kinase
LYSRETAPLIEAYGDRNVLVRVDGIGEIEVVTSRILAALAQRGFSA